MSESSWVLTEVDTSWVDGDRLPLLEDFSEAFGECLCRFADHLPAENVPHRVLDDLAFLFTVVPVELGEILKSQADRHLVGTCRCNQVVESPEIDGGKFVYDDRALELPLFVNELDDTAVIQ